jgi:hypothetical protein
MESRAACKGRDLRQPSRRRVRACLGCRCCSGHGRRARPRPERHRRVRAHQGCLPRQLELVVSVVVGRNRVVGTTGAQSLELYRRRCFYFCPYCCQFCHRQPCRPCRRRCSLCRRSLAFLCRSNLSLLPMLRAQGNRALRLSFGHGALVGGCYVGRGCLRRAAACLCRRGGMSRDNWCSCYRLRIEGGVGRG